MEKKSLLQDIDNYLLDNTVNNGLFNLFNDIKTYLTENSIPVKLPVMQKIADIKKEFEEQFCLIHTVEDYDNYWSYVDATATELWKFIEEKLSNFSA